LLSWRIARGEANCAEAAPVTDQHQRRELLAQAKRARRAAANPKHRRLAWRAVQAKVKAATACIAAESRIQV